jgi:hypothetical protein
VRQEEVQKERERENYAKEQMKDLLIRYDNYWGERLSDRMTLYGRLYTSGNRMRNTKKL